MVFCQAPLPLYSAIHVTNDRTALEFGDWLEFSPLEVGMSKYGTFMSPEDFLSKFYMGKVIEHSAECTLDFLRAIFGSAFVISFKALQEMLFETEDEKVSKLILDHKSPIISRHINRFLQVPDVKNPKSTEIIDSRYLRTFCSVVACTCWYM